MSLSSLTTAYIALGSNLGDRLDLLRQARARLAGHPQIGGCDSSPIYETDPVGGPPGQGRYLNAVLRVTTTLPPEPLLDLILRIETDLGRERNVRWAARTIDLDLLLYDDLVMTTPHLILPHPRLHQRAFVLEPLAALAPDVIHPLLRRSMAELAAVCPASGSVRRLPEEW